MPIVIAAAILGGIGFVLGLLIYVVQKYFGVEVDLSVQEVEKLLPRYNCGACGYAGCQEMATALLGKQAVPKQCKPLKAEDAVTLQAYLEEYYKNKK
ncbi:MAG: (Fe-S)-binding protein [Candidatus Izemoplasmatales bacterium]|jgi:electron transport complex protein RnfB|nr:(Fe-S)-binding protein [Candidatus Izemoplasmatales bacterium]MDD4354712.1 (Fe-S)-binding protein [Candidatus Izemoplasmatales bacterium]MDD4987591.1 (Fe-S)-binding protein [Candidatus Izemoplasmatales bacterium]MDD5602262.1 (Fe-S)-binding protein [Candidatus Izemoplasmatales bacterium]MDY0373127.1 (Fe-S)-binding protein [Candidatus Izemoplasmatales bacterium]